MMIPTWEGRLRASITVMPEPGRLSRARHSGNERRRSERSRIPRAVAAALFAKLGGLASRALLALLCAVRSAVRGAEVGRGAAAVGVARGQRGARRQVA